MPDVIPLTLLLCITDLIACAELSRLRKRLVAAAEFYGVALALSLGFVVAILSGSLIPLLG